MNRRAVTEGWALATMLVLSLALPTAALGQSAWALELEMGGARYSGTTSFADDDRRLLPASHTEGGVGLVHRVGEFTITTSASYAAPGLAVGGSAAEIVQKDVMSLYEFRLLALHDLVRLNRDIQAALGGGPALQVWNFTGVPSRYRLALQGRLGVTVPLSRRFALQLNGELAVTPSSPFEQADLPDGFERAAMWRRAFFLGVRADI